MADGSKQHQPLEMKAVDADECASSAPACVSVVSSNKENALPVLSPLSRHTPAPVSSASLKRQLFTQTAADKQPLSPTRAVQTYQH
jgi:hypothetical protein